MNSGNFDPTIELTQLGRSKEPREGGRRKRETDPLDRNFVSSNGLHSRAIHTCHVMNRRRRRRLRAGTWSELRAKHA